VKKQTSRKLATATLTLLVCVVGSLYLATRREAYQPHGIRPEDFPEILIAPPDAKLVDYSTPSNSGRREHTYGLLFVVDEAYPSDDTYQFVEKHLSSNGWQRLRYELLNPKSLRRAPHPVPPHLGSEAVNAILSGRKEIGTYPVVWRQEDWVNKEGDHIFVALSYSADLSTGQVRRDRVRVLIDLSQRHGPYIAQYKKLHPDEFDEGNAPEKSSNP